MKRPLQIVMAMLAASALPARANDSTAEIGAGGIELVRNSEISMVKEVLYLSPAEVKVDYIFRNNTDRDVEYLVAFPMPDIVPIDYMEGDNGVPERESENFMGFSVTVDGKRQPVQHQIRALSYNIDITADLKAHNVPLNPLSEAAWKALEKLPDDVARDWSRRGFVNLELEPVRATPAWTLSSVYYWSQTFPAKAEIAVSHTYTPAIGAFFYSPNEEAYTLQTDATYCIDATTKKAIKSKATGEAGDFVIAKSLRYILTTANNWAGLISDFTLIIDKADPDNIVSLCMDGVKKTGHTTFEVRKKDWAPEADLRILFLERPKAN